MSDNVLPQGTDQQVDELAFVKADVFGRIDQIAEALLKQDPMLPVHLREIHKNLIQYEELVHLLSDEQIKNLVAGQKKHAGMSLIKEATTAKKTTRIPKTTVDDL